MKPNFKIFRTLVLTVALIAAGQNVWAAGTTRTVTYTITSISNGDNGEQITFTPSNSGFGTSTGTKVATISNPQNTNGFEVQLDDGVTLGLSLKSGSSISFIHDNNSVHYGILLNTNGDQHVKFTVACTDYYITHVKLAQLDGTTLKGTGNPAPTSSGSLDLDVDIDKATYNHSDYQAWVTANTDFGQLTITLSDSPRPYTITYVDAVNGQHYVTNDNPTLYNVATPTFQITAPERTGYIFEGFYDNAGLSGSPVTLPLTITRGEAATQKDRTFYAKWSVIPWAGDGSKGNPWQIQYPSQLDLLAKRVNGTDGYTANEFRDEYFLQTAPITYDGTENNYTPIGKTNRYFRGHYNGGGYTVSGININTTGNSVGLFGYVYFPGTVENVILANSTIKGFTDVGGIVGYLYGDEYDDDVSNCRVESDVTIGAGSSSAPNHGGVVGTLRCGTISGCISAATITHNDLNYCQQFGGIVGYIEGDVTTVKDCLYTGSTVTAGSKTGAIVGSINNSSTLTNNYYTGDEVPGGVNGSDQDGARRARTVTLDENVALVGDETAYSLSGLTAIGTGDYALRYNYGSTNILYSGAEQALTLNCTETVPDGWTVVYTVNDAVIDGDAFMMPDDDVTVSAMVVKPMQTNTIALNAGWNWFSTNIDFFLNDLRSALVEAVPGTGTGITIKSKLQQTIYNPRNERWTGLLSTLDVAQMYMINVTSACEITLVGYDVDPAGHPIAINPGANWIGFPLSEAMTVADAFAGFAVRGDIITSQSAFAFYTGSTWRGTLATLEPGQGYIYHSAVSEERTFVFQEPQNQAGSGSAATPQYESHWSDFYYHNYQFHSPVVAAIRIGNDFIESNDNWADYEVAAFVGDECRGHAFLAEYNDIGDPYPIVELPVYYDEAGELVTFKLYNHANHSQYSVGGISILNPVEESTIDILTGENHLESYSFFDSESSVILSFIDDSPANEVTLSAHPSDGLYWATFYCEAARYTLPEGAQAYTMDAYYHLYRLGTDGRTIPENTAVVIIADKASITLTKTDDSSSITDNAPDPEHNSLTDGNILLGSDSGVDLDDEGKVPVPFTEDKGFPYVLSIDTNGTLGFRKYIGSGSDPAIPAHKAYYIKTE